MMQSYDIIIVGGGASGLFCSLFLPETAKVALLEKSDRLGTKVLLSGGERCNVTNSSILPERDYIGTSLKRLPGIFHAFSQEDMISFLDAHGIETVVEDNGRVLLKSGKSKQLLDMLVQESLACGVHHFLHQTILNVEHHPEETYPFTLHTEKEIFMVKKLVVATGGKSFPQVGASDFGYALAEQFGLKMVAPYRSLCGIETVEDLAALAGTTLPVELALYKEKTCIYTRKGSLLFTHRGISGPVVFDATLALGREAADQPITLRLSFDAESLTKKVVSFFSLRPGKMSVDLRFTALRSRQEAKVTGGGIILEELTTSFEAKYVPGLYFLGELVDVTGRSGGYNLQWAWSSAYVCGRGIGKSYYKL